MIPRILIIAARRRHPHENKNKEGCSMPSLSVFLAIIWAALFVVFVVTETLTIQLVSIWFAAGALVSFFLALFVTDSLLVQLAVFVAVSVLLLVCTRPLLRGVLHQKTVRTNADRSIGQEAIVTQRIDNLRGTGRILADGLSWSARAEDPGTVIDVNETVVITRIQGVTAFVSRQETLHPTTHPVM